MYKIKFIAVFTILNITVLSAAVFSQTAESHPPDSMLLEREIAKPANIFKRETLTNSWFGYGLKLADSGIEFALANTQIYQQNLHSGLSTHRRAGRYTGSYDMELNFDLEKLIGLKGASIFLHGEGGWSDGLDESSVGSLFGVNADAFGDQPIQLSEMYYEQWIGDWLAVRLGKLDLTGGFEHENCPVAFDGNAFANDESTQFLNGALVNNPTIPFPDYSLGAVVYLKLNKLWYLSAGVADADASGSETGFKTAFHGRTNTFAIFETGLTPKFGHLQGAYRIGFWYDSTRKERFDGKGTKSDDMGLYMSFDQIVYKVSENENDTRGLGVFARFGFADKDVSEIPFFWSVGTQYQGLIPNRDNDVLGFGVAQGCLSSQADFTASNETAMELYYNASITGWLQITPSVQYIMNPGGDAELNDAVAVGLRCQISF